MHNPLPREHAGRPGRRIEQARPHHGTVAASPQFPLEAAADDQLHRQVRDAIRFATVKDLDDVRVAETGQRRRFALKSPAQPATGMPAAQQDFDSDISVQRDWRAR